MSPQRPKRAAQIGRALVWTREGRGGDTSVALQRKTNATLSRGSGTVRQNHLRSDERLYSVV